MLTVPYLHDICMVALIKGLEHLCARLHVVQLGIHLKGGNKDGGWGVIARRV